MMTCAEFETLRKVLSIPKPNHHCKYCGQPLIWAQGVSWFVLPLDPDPHGEGKYALIKDRAVDIGDVPEWDGPKYQNHRATCVARNKAAEPKEKT